MKKVSLAASLMGLISLTGCATDRVLRIAEPGLTIRSDLSMSLRISDNLTALNPSSVTSSLSESPKNSETSPASTFKAESRLDLLVNNALAREVFLSLVADTRYSMLMHPDVKGSISVTLRGVTILEAMDAIRDVYGYDYKIDGRRITVYAPTIQTRIFTINYPHSKRTGVSDLRVSSGSALQAAGSAGSGGQSGGQAPGTSGSQNGNFGQQNQPSSSQVSTSSQTDIWAELADSIRAMLGSGVGRSVIASPHAGILAVHAMPDELRQVERFLKAAQINIERQVMLEAKIVEVELSDAFQSGIDWSALKNGGGATGAMGVLSGNTASNTLISGVQSNIPGFAGGAALAASGVGLPASGSGLFGLALARDGFQAVLGFLETRGDIQILSSPRIATMNNQKAVLKVGTDEFFVTGVSGGSGGTTSGTTTGTTPTLPTITMMPFFSGISLDVTPQIDDSNNITLHIHPSVTNVSEKIKQVDLGSIGNYRFPIASSNVNESDTLVKIQDGKIVAIGGLMQVESNQKTSGLPGTSDMPLFGTLLGNKSKSGRKKEVVVLIKPTIIRNSQDWDEQTRRARDDLDDMEASRARVIRIDGSVSAQPAPIAYTTPDSLSQPLAVGVPMPYPGVGVSGAVPRDVRLKKK